MEIELITRADLENFKRELLTEIKTLLQPQNEIKEDLKWVKSKDVQKLLQISPGTLQTLRNRKMIPFTRLGGVIYYSQEDLKKVLEKRGDEATDFFFKKNNHRVKKVKSQSRFEK
ncbi:DNA-binding protein [Algoriphagus lacus]|uniref:DNA-binding protein n=1 Tax=Algoriphagus lacus TaxID=2056311 RepID=A0A418PNC0_9BACT|nr:helix-turn-helix domain-containing protein [Algoriphagus lacus]RIW13328.1 DNA-binding protein [Algoriphagus lacus]